jgi:serine/threonine protein kinase
MFANDKKTLDHSSKGTRSSSAPWKGVDKLLTHSWTGLEFVDPPDDGDRLCDDENDYVDRNSTYRLDCFRTSVVPSQASTIDDVYTTNSNSTIPGNPSDSFYERPTFATSLKSRLTLSAFRRPEQTIRLTNSDPGRKLALEYDLQAPCCGVLGHGAFSTVRSAIRRRDGLRVAIKSIAKHEALRSRRLRYGGRSYLEEWEILRRFQDHPNVITLLDVLESDEEIQIVTEYCKGGELFDAIQRRRSRNSPKRQGQYSESEAAVITSQILSALVALHDNNIVHRDVKPENIVLANDDDQELRVKLCDFGVARPLVPLNGETDFLDADNSTNTTPGTDYYAAPELDVGGTYNAAVDIYSLGVVLYILLCGFPPVFSGDDADEVMFPKLYWTDVSIDAKNLLRRMLESDASERITARDALKNKWIVESNHIYHSNRSPRPIKLSYHRRMSSTGTTHSDRNGQLDLELVRSQLLRSLDSLNATPESPISKMCTNSTIPNGKSCAKRICHELSDSSNTSSPVAYDRKTPIKRTRYERRVSSAFLALADLYRDVATTPSGVYAAAAVGNPSEPSTPQLSPVTDEILVEELTSEQHERSMKLAALSF